MMGDDRLELAKAKELASVMGGAWHSEEWDVDSDSEQSRTKTDKGNANDSGSSKDGDKTNNKGGFLSRTLYRPKPSAAGANGSAHSSGSKQPNIPPKSGAGGNAKNGGWGGMGGRRSSGGVRRPADGRAPGRRDPAAVARLEAEAAARAKAEKGELDGRVDLSWQLPANVDYYSAPAALLRELVKEMPADKRLSFQTRVANARTKESIESVLEDYAERLENLVLPHARSREMDLQQVKKDTARERVVLDGEEIVFWGSASDKPHTWHEELWATLEARVMESVLSGGGATGSSEGSATAAAAKSKLGRGGNDEAVGGGGAAPAVGDKARALALEEWNKARAVATTSEVFKAMSRTGAGGDAYFALVALFCTADKLVVPVHCQESPITVEFLNRSSAAAGGKGARGRRSKERLSFGKKKGAGKGKGDDVHVLVTVPSTFDIYLRDGGTSGEGASGGGGGGGGGSGSGGISHGSAHSRGNGSGGGSGKIHRKSSTSSNHSNGDGAAAADASNALHLVRVKAVVEEEIWGLGRAGGGRSGGDGGGSPPEDGTPPTLRFLLDPERHNRRTSAGSGGWPDAPPAAAAAAAGAAGAGEAGGGSGGGEGELSMSRPPQAPAPLLALTRTERRMAVTVVPEPSAVSEMVRSFSRKIGVDVPSPQPPRVLGR